MWISESTRRDHCDSHWPTSLWKFFITHKLTRQHSFQPLSSLSGDHPTIVWVPSLPLASVQIVLNSLFISPNKKRGKGKWLEFLSLTSPHLRGYLWMWGGDGYASVSARFEWCATHPPSVWTKETHPWSRGGIVNLSGGEWGHDVSVKRSAGFLDRGWRMSSHCVDDGKGLTHNWAPQSVCFIQRIVCIRSKWVDY